MPVIQDILECFGICSACSICCDLHCWFDISYVLCGGFKFIFFKAELSSYSRCKVLNVQRTILVEGDLSKLFVVQPAAQDWVDVVLGLDCSGFCFLACKTYRNGALVLRGYLFSSL